MAARPDAQVAEVAIPTAKCENCEKTISDAVSKVDGVTGVQVDAKTHVAKVQFISAKANIGGVETAIANAGYNANKTTRNAKAYDKLESCCK
jgi:mercuric ion binding protein